MHIYTETIPSNHCGPHGPNSFIFMIFEMATLRMAHNTEKINVLQTKLEDHFFLNYFYFFYFFLNLSLEQSDLQVASDAKN